MVANSPNSTFYQSSIDGSTSNKCVVSISSNMNIYLPYVTGYNTKVIVKVKAARGDGSICGTDDSTTGVVVLVPQVSLQLLVLYGRFNWLLSSLLGPHLWDIIHEKPEGGWAKGTCVFVCVSQSQSIMRLGS